MQSSSQFITKVLALHQVCTNFLIIYEQVLYRGQIMMRLHNKKFMGQRAKLLARVTCRGIFHPYTRVFLSHGQRISH